jgi:thiamine-phosphate pyrophosphorylase
MSSAHGAGSGSIAGARLYGIVDLGYVQPGQVVSMTRALVAGGVDILQLRAKGQSVSDILEWGRAMHAVTRDAGVPLVINDHLEVAAELRTEGVHVGQDDDAIARARAMVPPGTIIGKSTHSLAQAVAAQAEGADYIGFGPLYATGTKPTYTPIGLADIAAVHQRVQVPIFCIGGVNDARLAEITAAGALRVVVVSAFLCAPDVQVAVARMKERLLRDA